MGRKRIAKLKSENKQSFKVSVEHLTGVTSVPSLSKSYKIIVREEAGVLGVF